MLFCGDAICLRATQRQIAWVHSQLFGETSEISFNVAEDRVSNSQITLNDKLEPTRERYSRRKPERGRISVDDGTPEIPEPGEHRRIPFGL
jgi:hypothetical protein